MLCANELAFEDFCFQISDFQHFFRLPCERYIAQIFHIAVGRALGNLLDGLLQFFKRNAHLFKNGNGYAFAFAYHAK